MDKIAAAFVAAQRGFAPALKTSNNPHFRTKYASLDACIEAVIDALNSNGIALLQPTHECPDGVMVETLFLHESGQTMSGGKLHVPAVKADPQGYGSALTYARRYSLMSACGIAPEDDDGNAASRRAPAPDVASIVRGIRQAQNAAALKSHFTAAWQMLEGEARDKAKAAYDARKAELEPQEAAA